MYWRKISISFFNYCTVAVSTFQLFTNESKKCECDVWSIVITALKSWNLSLPGNMATLLIRPISTIGDDRTNRVSLYYEVCPQLISWENRRKIEPKEISSCLIFHWLVFTWQLEILLTALDCSANPHIHFGHVETQTMQTADCRLGRPSRLCRLCRLSVIFLLVPPFSSKIFTIVSCFFSLYMCTVHHHHMCTDVYLQGSWVGNEKMTGSCLPADVKAVRVLLAAPLSHRSEHDGGR